MYAHLDGASNDFIVTDIVYGTDGILQLRLITDIFQEKYCPSLASKPKLFFIQVSIVFKSVTKHILCLLDQIVIY